MSDDFFFYFCAVCFLVLYGLVVFLVRASSLQAQDRKQKRNNKIREAVALFLCDWPEAHFSEETLRRIVIERLGLRQEGAKQADLDRLSVNGAIANLVAAGQVSEKLRTWNFKQELVYCISEESPEAEEQKENLKEEGNP